jgi:hypothetical protein
MDLEGVGGKGVNFTDLAQDRGRLRVMTSEVHKMSGILDQLINC